MDQHIDLYLTDDDLKYADVDLTDSLTSRVRPVITLADRAAGRQVVNVYGGTRGAPVDPLLFADVLEGWASRLRALNADRVAREREDGPHEGEHAHCAICRASEDRIGA